MIGNELVESNIGDSGNTGDGGKIDGGAIEARRIVPLDLSKDIKPYIKLRSSRSIYWDQQVAETTSTTLTARLPILNPREYDLWLMRIEQYFLMTDYSFWEVILNGNKVLKRTTRETEQEYEPTTVEEKQDRRNEMKARGTLLMALPNKDQLNAYGVSAAHTQCNPTSGDNLSDAKICAFLASQPNSPQLAREDLEQIDPGDLEEMVLQ
ncbi:hypothetical protein Tco_1039810 [Tanacetum coccineum]